jgi:hypothetical protein
LAEIKDSIDDIKALLLLVNQDKLEEMKKHLLKSGSIESRVYGFCDGNVTTQDLAVAIQKAPDYAAAVVSTLRRKGLVRTVDKEGKKVHEQRF